MSSQNGLLIFPPQWYPGNPYSAVPLLLGRLKNAGYPVTGLDLNIEFYHHILSPDFLSRIAPKAGSRKAFADSLIHRLTETVEDTVTVFSTPELFYDPDRLFRAKSDISEILDYISEAYYPARLGFANFFHPGIKDVSTLCAYTFDENTNIFLEFFEARVDDILSSSPAYIMISAADVTQLLAVFTLGRLIKERSEIPVCFGGSIFTKLKSAFICHPEIFGKYTDCIAFGNGENNIVKLAEHFCGRLPIADVPGCIYRDTSGSVIENAEECASVLEKPAVFSFDGYDLSKYFSPEPVMTIQLSKGCYWGKCAFCDVSFSRQNFEQKPPAAAVAEIELLVHQYGIRHFIIGDDSVSPQYYREFSRLIKERDLHINCFIMARLETGFDEETLRSMYASGCRIVFWGYEAYCEEVMQKINKGIDCGQREHILRSAYDAGIWNHVAFMTGFPGETVPQAQKTVAFVQQHADLIQSCYLSKFSMKKNAIISQAPAQYGITNITDDGELSLDYKYDGPPMNYQDKKQMDALFREMYLRARQNRLWPLMCVDFEHALLYISRFGRDFVQNYELSVSTDRLYTGFPIL